MNTDPISHAEEQADPQPRFGTHPPHRTHALEAELAEPFAPHTPLPCRADRQKIVEQAALVLSEARAVTEHWDRSFDNR